MSLTDGEQERMMKFQELYEENGESLTGWDKGFADDIVGKFVEYGAEMFLSPNQWKQVNRILERMGG